MTDVVDGREPVSARRAATRSRLAEAAVRVFARKGVDGASVEEICDEAGFSRGAFYSNFESKNDLCIDVMQRSVDQTMATLTSELPKVTGTGLPIGAKLDLAINLFLSMVSNDPEVVLAIAEIRLQAARDPVLRPAYKALFDAATPQIRQLVTEILEANGVHLGIDVDDMLSIMRTLYDQQRIEAVINGVPDPSSAVAEQMTLLLKALIKG